MRDELESIPIVKLKLGDGATVPMYANFYDSGADITSTEDVVIPSMERRTIGTGLFAQIPYPLEGQIRSRSGLASKKGVFVLNSPGTIDSGYRGEIKVILQNMGKEDFVVNKGDRIAQIVFTKVEYPDLEISYELDETERGEGGFGSTGV